MSSSLLLVLAIEAVLATVPTVLLIPRARQSPLFDRVLWLSTWTLAFLGACYAPSLIAADSPWNSFIIGDVPIVPTMLGAIVGALLLNGLLFVMDRFSEQEVEPDETIPEPTIDEPPIQSDQPKESVANEPAEAKTDAPSEQ